jgi:hypothetical protein
VQLIKSSRYYCSPSFEGILDIPIAILTLLHQTFLVPLLEFIVVSLLQEAAHSLTSDLAGGNEFRILPESFSTHGLSEHLDGLECQSWPDLNHYQLLNIVLLSEHGLLLVANLVDT